MDVKSEVEVIERRVRAAGFTVAEMLRRAQVNSSQWVRWKQGGQEPLLATWTRVQRAAAELASPTEAAE